MKHKEWPSPWEANRRAPRERFLAYLLLPLLSPFLLGLYVESLLERIESERCREIITALPINCTLIGIATYIVMKDTNSTLQYTYFEVLAWGFISSLWTALGCIFDHDMKRFSLKSRIASAANVFLYLLGYNIVFCALRKLRHLLFFVKPCF